MKTSDANTSHANTSHRGVHRLEMKTEEIGLMMEKGRKM
jgi:hypothetical protein